MGRERAAERGGGAVPDGGRDVLNRTRDVPEQPARLPHPDVPEHLRGSAAERAAEPLAQRGTRQVDEARHPLDGPRLRRPGGHRGHHRGHGLVPLLRAAALVVLPGGGHRGADQAAVADGEQGRAARALERALRDERHDAGVPVAEAPDHQRARQPADRDGHVQVRDDQNGLLVPLRRGEPVSGAGIDEDGVALGERLRLGRRLKHDLTRQHQRPQRGGAVGERCARREQDVVHAGHLPRRFRRGGSCLVCP